jgi:hypothetical protein
MYPLFFSFLTCINGSSTKLALYNMPSPPPSTAMGRSTINGTPERGTGVLNNELHIKRLALHYVKDPSTGKRASLPTRGQVNHQGRARVTTIAPAKVPENPISLALSARSFCSPCKIADTHFRRTLCRGVGSSFAHRTARLECIVHHFGLTLGGRPPASLRAWPVAQSTCGQGCIAAARVDPAVQRPAALICDDTGRLQCSSRYRRYAARRRERRYGYRPISHSVPYDDGL